MSLSKTALREQYGAQIDFHLSILSLFLPHSSSLSVPDTSEWMDVCCCHEGGTGWGWGSIDWTTKAKMWSPRRSRYHCPAKRAKCHTEEKSQRKAVQNNMGERDIYSSSRHLAFYKSNRYLMKKNGATGFRKRWIFDRLVVYLGIFISFPQSSSGKCRVL